MKKNSFVFYRSFAEALAEMSEADALELLRAIIGYGLDMAEPTVKRKYVRMAWMLIKPQLDANWQRYENGCKGGEYGNRGGAPKGNRNAAKAKQPQNNPKTTPNDNDNDNDNVNVDKKKDAKALSHTHDHINVHDKAIAEADANLIDWMRQNCPDLLQAKNFKHYVTGEELERLKRTHTADKIVSIIMDIANRPDKYKRYANLYSTIINWLRIESKKK